MAEFNPDVGGVPSANMPDQTGASRGTVSNRAFESLFAGVGDLIGGAAKAVDESIKTNIRKDANDIFSTAMAPYDLPPGDLTKGLASVKALVAAHDQGKLTDTYFYGYLNTELKSLRAKYPGYEEAVDATIQEVTGVRPANSLRSAIMAELNAQEQEASDTEKAWKTFENQHLDTLGFIYSDYFTNPTKYEGRRAEVKAAVARWEGVKANDQYIKNQSADAVYATSTASLSMDVNAAIENIPRSLGLEDDNIYQFLEKASKIAPTAEESLALTASIDQLILKMESSIDAQMIKTREAAGQQPGDPPVSWFSILGATKAKEVKEQVLAPLRNIRQYINNGDFSLAAYATQLASALKNDDVNRLLTGNGGEYFRAKLAADSVDPEVFQDWVAKNPDARASAYESAIPELLARIATKDGVSTNKIATDIANNTAVPEADRAGALNSLINGVNSTLSAGSNATPDNVTKTVMNTYANDADGDIFTLVSDEDFMNVYNRMFAPDVTQNVMAKASPEAKKAYADSALERFQSVPEFRHAAAALKNFVEIDDNLLVTFDKNGQIVVSFGNAPNAGDNPYLNQAINKSRVAAAQNAIEALNRSFNLLDPIIMPEGGSTEEKLKAHEQLLNLLSTNLGAGKEMDFFDWIAKEVLPILGDKEFGMGQSPQPDIAFNLPDEVLMGSSDDLTNYFANIRQAESAGNDSAVNSDSGATGRYQVLTSTWNQYAPGLGLTDRTDPVQQEKFIRAFTADNEAALNRAGIPITNASRYAAHFLGAGSAIDVLQASDSSRMVDLLPPRVIQSNPVLKNMTVADFKRWLTRKAG